MKQHAFNQHEVHMLELRIGRRFKTDKWNHFSSICRDLGYKVRVTGGNFLTHQIDTTEEEFNILLDLAR